MNGTYGISDIEGKAAMGSGERWEASEFQLRTPRKIDQEARNPGTERVLKAATPQ